MAFPTPRATNTGVADSSASTSHTANLPAGIVSGDLLILVLGGRDPGTTSATGWTFLAKTVNTAALQIGYRVADGSEGSTVTVSTTNSFKGTFISYAIPGTDTGTPPEQGTAATGSSTAADPPNLTPSWGAADTLWLAVAAIANPTAPAAPTNYSNLLTSAVGSAPTVGVASAQRQLNAASENPGAFTNASSTWVANTLAIKPATAVIIPQTLSVSSASATTAIKTPTLLRAVSSVTATARVLRPGKVLAIASATATALTKVNIRVVTAAVACTGAIAKNLAVTKIVAVAAHPAVACIKAITHALAVSSATATAAIRSIGKPLSMSVSTSTAKTIRPGKLIAISLQGSLARTLAVTHTLAMGCASAVTRTKAITHTLAVTCTSATAAIKRAGKILTTAVLTAVVESGIRAKVIAIALHASVTQQKFISRTLAVSCRVAVNRILSGGVFPVIRAVRAVLYKIRGGDAALKKSRDGPDALYKARDRDPGLDQ